MQRFKERDMFMMPLIHNGPLFRFVINIKT